MAYNNLIVEAKFLGRRAGGAKSTAPRISSCHRARGGRRPSFGAQCRNYVQGRPNAIFVLVEHPAVATFGGVWVVIVNCPNPMASHCFVQPQQQSALPTYCGLCVVHNLHFSFSFGRGGCFLLVASNRFYVYLASLLTLIDQSIRFFIPLRLIRRSKSKPWRA